ncbi:sterol desaturase family protein [Legionella fallonii]|uniref:Putative sterol desaturase n=1 Tax=Legionella fallonii LLAP-10 TaxID=1212491 RepID=A0A098G337_9GAMM|nr:sterol desaturase family protein [Legionella fallonii]CEG56868.1 putative sterol desaturase [Legionella fallonii LLAP-10]
MMQLFQMFVSISSLSILNSQFINQILSFSEVQRDVVSSLKKLVKNSDYYSMPNDGGILLIGILIFFILIGLEYGYGVIKNKNNYRLNDSISSLSQGLLSQLFDAISRQFFTLGIFIIIYQSTPHLHITHFWYTWYGIISAVIFYDFCDYWLHRASHRVALLWAAHVVHHQSQSFNFTTSLRQETFYMLPGFVFYIPLPLLGVPPDLFALSGIVVLYYQFWIHTEHIGKLGILEQLISTPSNHRVHHGVNEKYINKNYGAILIIWDRLFGTYQEETEKPIYGTLHPLNSWCPIKTITQVYSLLIKRALNTKGFLNRIKIFYKPPEWNSAANPSVSMQDIKEIATYDPPISKLSKWIAGSLFVIFFICSLYFILLSEHFSLWPGLGCAITILTGLYCVGLLIDKPQKK